MTCLFIFNHLCTFSNKLFCRWIGLIVAIRKSTEAGTHSHVQPLWSIAAWCSLLKTVSVHEYNPPLWTHQAFCAVSALIVPRIGSGWKSVGTSGTWCAPVATYHVSSFIGHQISGFGIHMTRPSHNPVVSPSGGYGYGVTKWLGHLWGEVLQFHSFYISNQHSLNASCPMEVYAWN